MKNKGGRPSKYKPEFCEKIITYFDQPFFEDKVVEAEETYYKEGGRKSVRSKIQQIARPLRFISQFAREIGVSRDTLNEWSKTYPEFSDALKVAKELQEEHLVTCGLKGLFNPSFGIFSAKNMIGWRDEQVIKGDGPDGEIVIRVERAQLADNLQAPRFAVPDLQ